jgi:hypothetical protein
MNVGIYIDKRMAPCPFGNHVVIHRGTGLSMGVVDEGQLFIDFVK